MVSLVKRVVVELHGRDIVLQLFTDGAFVAHDERTGRYLKQGQMTFSKIYWESRKPQPKTCFNDIELERLGKALSKMYVGGARCEGRVTMKYQEKNETPTEQRQRVREQGLKMSREVELELLQFRVKELEEAHTRDVAQINAALGGSLQKTIALWPTDVVTAILRLKKDERGLALLRQTTEND